MPPACSVPASMCERFSTGWGTNRWRRPCDIWYRRAMFTTDLIRLSYPASIRTQVRQESPSNRKWVLAKGPFVVGIDSISDGSSIAARDSNPKNVLGPIRTALREEAVALPLLGAK